MNLKIVKLQNYLMKASGVILVILTALLVISSVWTYNAYVQTEFREEQSLTSEYTHTGGYAYHAKVVNPNNLYDVGDYLGMEHPVYFYAITPTAITNFTYKLTASHSLDMDIKQWTMVVTKVEDKNSTLWKNQYTLKSEEATLTKNETSLSYNFAVDINAIKSKIDIIKKQLKFNEDPSIEINTYVVGTGTINGQEVNTTKVYTLPVTVQSSYYKFYNKDREYESVETFETEQVLVPKNPGHKIPSLIITVSLGILILCLSIFRYNYVEANQITLTWAKEEAQTKKYSEWISNGKVPEQFDYMKTIELASIEDLVNLAVDINSRVIYDKVKDVYFLVSESIVYRYK